MPTKRKKPGKKVAAATPAVSRKTKKNRGGQAPRLNGGADGTKYESVPLSSLTPDPRNARKHGEQNLAAIVRSLKRWGQQKPIVVDADGVVLAGNGTLAGARELGWTHINVVRSSLRGEEARAYAIADNRTAELAEWDAAELQRTAKELEAALADFDLGDIGFEDGQLDSLLADLLPANETPGGGGDAGDGGTDPEHEPAGGGGAAGGEYQPQYKIIVDCADEAQQAERIAHLEGLGWEFTAPNVG